jgi:hypothetical protein
MTSHSVLAPAVLAVCILLTASGCGGTPRRDHGSSTSAGLDVSAPAILSYRPLSEDGARFIARLQRGPQAHAGDRLLIRDGRGKQMASYDSSEWAGPRP